MSKMKCIALAAMMVLLAGQSLRAQVCGSTNIALTNTTASASSSINATVPASLIDGNISTIWQPTQSGEQYATLDLGSVKNVCEITIKWGRWNVPSAFQIQITESLTSPNWVTVVDVPSNNNFSTQGFDYAYNTLSIPANGNVGRGVRLKMNIPNGSNWFVYEIEVFATTTNSVPGASLISPTADTTIAANTPIELKATANDPDGSISEVAFYNGSTLLALAPQTSSPYAYTWIPTSPGTYVIKATAKDNIGAIGHSLTKTITVTSPNVGWSLLGNTLAPNQTAFLGTIDTLPIIIRTNNVERYRVTKEGRLLIGSTTLVNNAPASTLLTVNGFIMARGLKITQSGTAWPDYVFAKSYKLMPLQELSLFIKRNKHLPGIPNAAQVKKDGINLAESHATLLKKVEELTLYIISLQEQVDQLKQRQSLIEK